MSVNGSNSGGLGSGDVETKGVKSGEASDEMREGSGLIGVGVTTWATVTEGVALFRTLLASDDFELI